MNEDKYWSLYRAVRSDVVKASYCYHSSKEIHSYAAENRANFHRLNEHATFWNVVLHGLQIGWFMALSRLFDTGRDTISMGNFLRHTGDHPEFFSKEAFDARRMRDARDGVRPDWLDAYIAGIWVPNSGDLRAIGRMLRPYRQKWGTDYVDIRDKVFAHTIATEQADVNALFSRTLIADIEDILEGLQKIVGVIEELWSNGRHPDQYHPDNRFVEEVVAETRDRLRA